MSLRRRAPMPKLSPPIEPLAVRRCRLCPPTRRQLGLIGALLLIAGALGAAAVYLAWKGMP